MSTWLLTEAVDVPPLHVEGPCASTRILPGLCDGDTLRAMIGESLFERAVACGVLQPIP